MYRILRDELGDALARRFYASSSFEAVAVRLHSCADCLSVVILQPQYVANLILPQLLVCAHGLGLVVSRLETASPH